MRLPLFWLTDYVDPGMDASKLAARLAMTGTEVDRVHTHGVSALENFVVGRVLEREQHPDADRLSVCQVAIGEGDVSTIVCGAPNVAAGQTVGVALPGSVMPDGTRLKKAKLRGVPSNGMILAEDEVGIGSDHAGIMVLDDDLVPGTPLAQVLPISTDVLELEITPNRPDCLSVYGVAREVHAATGAPLNPPPWMEDPGTPGPVEGVTVEVQDAEFCPRFTARLFEDVKIGPSPRWLKARLMAAGQRPINNVVDITNYVMLLTGQPLHAFNFDLVAGGKLVVRRAGQGEQMTTLDDQVRTLDSSMHLIDDGEGPTSIAGIMGGQRSEVREDTTRVLMEAANWHGPTLQRTSQKLGLRTEASGRFEKGLPPEQSMWGTIVATQLMLELTGARLAPGTIDVGGEGPAPKTIRLREEKVTRLLGTAVPIREQADILEALEFDVHDAGDGLDVTVPAFRRNDVTREVDLIEEVARIWGLEKLPATIPGHGMSARLTPEQRLRRRAGDALVGAGFSEAIGWSFQAPEMARRLRIDDSAVKLRNPLSEDLAVMRTTLLGSLLTSVRHNTARGAEDVRLFEKGSVYFDRPHRREPTAAEARSTPLPDERMHLAALMTGRIRPASWGDGNPPTADFFAAKGVLETVLGALRVDFTVVRGADPFLHPGRAARVLVGGEDAGWLGEIHPGVAAEFGLARVAGFELDFGAVLPHAVVAPHYEDLTSFPAIRQDLAFWVPADRTASELVEVVRGAGGKLLKDVRVFDVYAREGQTSLAVRLEFRAGDRTLTDDEISPQREKIVKAVAEKLEGELRG
ncbi:phenylalanine--tRNA ligase subunit beta [Solirubrobacter sp. CPCC 204708]|uniref:Phenylalanine--tRNA ligase beta subunit n=1 Tax=Solirubrobacter deserti TaxID=2282478 RepID=A0ABT4RNN0_9ACTN|nr:phenylalanine--tRNA ligase subunit beta [Solirubrobacter deserti]MBE2314941.1 phenylalanine--tRNA ligase subunit beta [Solirubrobacter deserti]MDA0140171.1 phenylalanine--tRNA ligase subunit beta [Solirubrobacter deserti]